VLFEQAPVVGGQLRVAAAGPTRGELLDFVVYLERELERLNVDVRLGTEATRDAVLAKARSRRRRDRRIAAAAGLPDRRRRARRHGVGHPRRRARRATRARRRARRRLRLLDGISAAEYLAEQGVAVELITPARGVGLAIPHESLPARSRGCAATASASARS